ncbi:alpha/beta hydrolase [Mangrovibrevibacter kandeliae]|uniref:alpha/beta hydrolase n=1 Tax=Mangrovibrevibacter kandeliae TaxID=2968473 RepID=UPI002117D081|nr:alpha/beta hydrolase [Aurantimonas sp. CSK15Z-1]MCQ8782930.1 alpha/beta hydrolase [Aurantimonas sp. CSK15Z-1]
MRLTNPDGRKELSPIAVLRVLVERGTALHLRQDGCLRNESVEELEWAWNGQTVRIGVTSVGQGPLVLLLPALSSISTRQEFAPLQRRLAASFTTVSVDWPGFGDLPRPAIAWSPTALSAFLDHVLDEVLQAPYATLSAGHAASYVLDSERERTGRAGRLVLLSPTWRGPLPTMFGRRLPIFRRVAQAVDLPVLGEALYRTNVNAPMIRMMVGAHVYRDRRRLTPDWMKSKRCVTDAPGARHASLRFVTGGLDRFNSREQFLDAARACQAPIDVIYGDDCPPKSKAEMDALAALPNVHSSIVTEGKLSFYEEFPEETASLVISRLASRPGDRTSTAKSV